jgi:hypothetical protein
MHAAPWSAHFNEHDTPVHESGQEMPQPAIQKERERWVQNEDRSERAIRDISGTDC